MPVPADKCLSQRDSHMSIRFHDRRLLTMDIVGPKVNGCGETRSFAGLLVVSKGEGRLIVRSETFRPFVLTTDRASIHRRVHTLLFHDVCQKKSNEAEPRTR